MATWFQCKIQYIKFLENDKVKTVSEVYLIDSVSFTDAEARLYRSLGSTIPDFNIVSVSKTGFREVFNYEDTEQWYKVKVSYVDVDEASGKEKRVNTPVLISAANPRQALDRVEEQFASWVVPWEVTDINISPIIEVIPYVSEEEEAIKGGKLRPVSEQPQQAIDDTLIEVEEEIIEEEDIEETETGDETEGIEG